jgi:hypothetical protein
MSSGYVSTHDLLSQCDNMQKDMDDLKEGVKKLQEDMNDTRIRLEIIEKDTQILSRECYRNITKEAMIKLQKFIMREIMGPSNGYKPWLYFHIEKLFANPDYKEKCDQYMKDHQITINHIWLIERYIKKYWMLSDLAKKYSRMQFILRSEWEDIIISMLGEDKDDEDIKMTHDLLNLMEHYIKVDEDGSWDILAYL